MFSGYARWSIVLTSDVETFLDTPRDYWTRNDDASREQAERFGCEVIDKNVASVDFHPGHSKLRLKMKFLT